MNFAAGFHASCRIPTQDVRLLHSSVVGTESDRVCRRSVAEAIVGEGDFGVIRHVRCVESQAYLSAVSIVLPVPLLQSPAFNSSKASSSEENLTENINDLFCREVDKARAKDSTVSSTNMLLFVRTNPDLFFFFIQSWFLPAVQSCSHSSFCTGAPDNSKTMKIACSVALVVMAGSPHGGAGFHTGTARTGNMRSQRIMRMAGRKMVYVCTAADYSVCTQSVVTLETG